jgi:hypothetical protein
MEESGICRRRGAKRFAAEDPCALILVFRGKEPP